MTSSTPGGLRDPLPAVPPRRPGSVRRTMHVDVGARGEWSSPLAMEGGARDLRTGTRGPEDQEVLATATVTAGFDMARRLESLATDPPAPWAEQLVGARAGGGFRRELDAVVPPTEAGSLVRQVLDDMPAAALISGYGFMRMARRQGHHPGSLMPQGALGRMTDLCSGWRRGGVAVLAVEAGKGVPLQDCPPAPAGFEQEPGSWHDVRPLQRDWMRRRRCIDVAAGSDGSFEIWAMFRDTVGEEDEELVLHEYAVAAAGRHGVLERVDAEPRVLPFPECPAAADAVGRLAGAPLHSLSRTVPDVLSGIASCTHLNDLLRALAGVDDLLALAG